MQVTSRQRVGRIDVLRVTGNPNGQIKAPAGSLAIDPTGALYVAGVSVLSWNAAGGGGSGSGMVSDVGTFTNYAALNLAHPASLAIKDAVAYVQNATGIYLINRKNKGWYICDGSNWVPWEADDYAADLLGQHLVDYDHASIVDKIHNIENIVVVQTNPGPGQFSTVAAALASITTNSSTNPFVVWVGPGLYIGDTITTKPYVSIIGEGQDRTFFQSDATSKDVFHISGNNVWIEGCTVMGASDVGKAGVSYTGTEAGTSCYLINVRFTGNNIQVLNKPNGVSFIMTAEGCTFGATAYATGFLAQQTAGGASTILIRNSAFIMPNAITSFAVADGSGCSIAATASNIRTTNGTGTAFLAQDGGRLQLLAVNIGGFTKGIHMPNTGLSTIITAHSLNFDACTQDLVVEHTSATGVVEGSVDITKISIVSSSSVYVPFRDPQIITVAKKGGDFTTFAAALAFITDASVSKPYLIKGSPGTFIEDTLTMKPYVYIQGSGNEATVIQVDTPTKKVVVGADHSGILSCGITGATGIGGVGVYHEGSGTLTPFLVRDCYFMNNETCAKAHGAAALTILQIDLCRMGGTTNFTTGFVCSNVSSIPTQVVITNTIHQDVLNPGCTKFASAAGAGTALVIDNVLSRNYPAAGTQFVHVENGAEVRMLATSIRGYDSAIHSANVGAAPKIYAQGINVNDSLTWDIHIEHPSTVGNYLGTYSVDKISISNGAPFFIAGKDLNIVTVAVRGGDFSSIAAACDFITDADPDTNPYLILVGPGIFAEPEINLKPGISVRGSSIQTTIVNPDANNHNIFNLAQTSELSFMSISGAGSGYVAVMADDIGDFGQLHKISMYDNDTNIKVRSVTQDTYLYLEYVDINGVYVDGLYVESSNGYASHANIENFYTFNDAANAGRDVFITGTAALVETQVVVLQGSGSNIGIRMENGSTLRANSTRIEDADIGVHLPNVGSGQHLQCPGIQTVNTGTNNFKIEHPSADGYVATSSDITLMSVNPSASVKFNIVDNDPLSSVGLTVVGDIYHGSKIGNVQNISDFSREGVNAGLVDADNGVLSQGTNPLELDVAPGKAYVIDNLDAEHIHTWTATTLTVPDNSKYYVTVNSAGTLQLESSLPANPENRALLGYVVSLGGVLVAISNSFERADHSDNHLSQKDRNVNGAQFATGCLVTENVGTPLAIDVTPGEYWYGMRRFLPSGMTAGNMRELYRDGVGGTTLGSLITTIPSKYDDNSGTLATIPGNKYVKHALALVGDGAEESYMLVYGQTLHNSLLDAQYGALPVLPSFIEESITVIASIIIHDGDANIASIEDERRLSGFVGSGGAAITDHGSMTGLADNDHPQYLLRDGSNAMTANLNLGGFTLSNVGTALPGTTTAAPVAQTPDQSNTEGVSAHKARADHVHNIPTATAVTIGTSNQQGTAATFARSDHVHNHGNLGGGSQHAAVTTLVNGFMIAADKVKLDLVSSAELGYVAGVTSAIQTQLNGKAASGANTDLTSVLLDQGGLVTKGGDANALIIRLNETLTANRTLNIVLGNADRSLTITGTTSISGTHSGTSSGTNTGDQTISLTGDVTGSGTSSFAATIGANVVSNAKLAQVATATFKGRTTAGIGNVEDLTVTQATALLNVMVGDTGTGGIKGLVPAPVAGDGSKFLRGDGTWAANASGTVTVVSVVTANGFAGTVATDTSTPAITLTTSVSGILQGNGTAISAATTTGSGSVVLATSPVLVTPTLGVASATSINKVAITAPATSATLTIADGKTLTVSNTLTFTGTDTASVAFGAGGTVAYAANTLAVFAATTSAQLAGVITDETGSGSLVFANTPTLVTPVLGVATATSINKVAITAPASGATLTIADGKTLSVSNSLTFTGTDGSSVSFAAGGAVAYTDKANVFGDFDQSFRSTRLRIANPANTQYYTFTTSAITANRAITIPLLSQNETMAIRGQIIQSNPANPAGTASTTGVMMGLAVAFTPRVTGRIRITVDGTYSCANAGSEVTIQVRTGTGVAPANGAALTGTVSGASPIADAAATGETIPFSMVRVVTGLVLETAIWVDLGLTRGGTNSTVSVQTLNITITEE